MPQSWNMGQILSFPLRRKACGGFFRCQKNPTTSAGFQPANSGTTRPPKQSTEYERHYQFPCNECPFCHLTPTPTPAFSLRVTKRHETPYQAIIQRQTDFASLIGVYIIHRSILSWCCHVDKYL